MYINKHTPTTQSCYCQQWSVLMKHPTDIYVSLKFLRLCFLLNLIFSHSMSHSRNVYCTSPSISDYVPLRIFFKTRSDARALTNTHAHKQTNKSQFRYQTEPTSLQDATKLLVKLNEWKSNWCVCQINKVLTETTK